MAKCRMVLAFTVILVGICLCSCKIEKISSEKTKDVEYTIVPENEIPQEVKKVIDEKKGSEFKLAYTDPEYTYILIQTKFKGPKEYSNIQSETFPYIVIKIESTNKNIIFAE